MEVFILIAVIALILIMWFSIKAEPSDDDAGETEKADSDTNQQGKP